MNRLWTRTPIAGELRARARMGAGFLEEAIEGLSLFASAAHQGVADRSLSDAAELTLRFEVFRGARA